MVSAFETPSTNEAVRAILANVLHDFPPGHPLWYQIESLMAFKAHKIPGGYRLDYKRRLSLIRQSMERDLTQLDVEYSTVIKIITEVLAAVAFTLGDDFTAKYIPRDQIPGPMQRHMVIFAELSANRASLVSTIQQPVLQSIVASFPPLEMLTDSLVREGTIEGALVELGLKQRNLATLGSAVERFIRHGVRGRQGGGTTLLLRRMLWSLWLKAPTDILNCCGQPVQKAIDKAVDLTFAQFAGHPQRFTGAESRLIREFQRFLMYLTISDLVANLENKAMSEGQFQRAFPLLAPDDPQGLGLEFILYAKNLGPIGRRRIEDKAKKFSGALILSLDWMQYWQRPLEYRNLSTLRAHLLRVLGAERAAIITDIKECLIIGISPAIRVYANGLNFVDMLLSLTDTDELTPALLLNCLRYNFVDVLAYDYAQKVTALKSEEG